MSARPLIGITRDNRLKSKLLYFIGALTIWLMGGKPIAITAYNSHFEKNIQGMILYGGKDIHPKFYNGKIAENYSYTENRDTMEFKWLEKCEKESIPILGICRGLQVMNVAHGGTLYFDIRKIYGKKAYPSGLFAKIFFRKKILIEENSFFNKIVQTTQLYVNSSNKQVIKKLGRNLNVVAREKNTMIQVIEDPLKPFYLGLQFHPEYFIFSKSMRNIFKVFIESAKVIHKTKPI